jgi:hypothetical protein
MGKKRDLNFTTYIWTQFAESLVRSTMLKINGNKLVHAVDSDNDPLSNESGDDDDSGLDNKAKIEPVRLILNNRDFIYYITKLNGKCHIMEGNPRDPYIEKHESIYSLKAECC